jgi:hypothetical protein
MSPTDCTLTFGFLPDVNAPVQVIQDEVTISMTLPLLKSLVINFVKTVAAIERELGPIKVVAKTLATDEQIASVIQVLRDNPLSDVSLPSFPDES